MQTSGRPPSLGLTLPLSTSLGPLSTSPRLTFREFTRDSRTAKNYFGTVAASSFALEVGESPRGLRLFDILPILSRMYDLFDLISY